jgi:acyl-CoA reductase-like NAD-dependent aldehyde dehydrogenase
MTRDPHDETLPAIRSANSPEWLQTQKHELTRTASQADLVRQVARLAAAFGDSRIATPEQRGMLLREWGEAFAGQSPEHLHRAVSEAIKTSKFWPTIAEIHGHVASLRRETIAAIDTVTGRGRYRGEANGFARDGRTSEQEQAHRSEQLKRWKQQAGFDRLLAEDGPAHQPRPVSQAGASEALLASRAVQAIKGREQEP